MNDGGTGWGGGIYNLGAVTLTQSTISGNRAENNPTEANKAAVSAYGGGIYNAGTLSLTDARVINNDVGGAIQLRPITSWGRAYGGGIWSAGGLTVSGSLINGNVAWGSCNPSSQETPEGYGGGLMLAALSTTSITTSAIDGNTAGSGGGLYADMSDFGLRPVGEGGGIHNAGDLTVTRTTLAENTASGRLAFGGGLYDAGVASLTNVTISGNAAAGWGVVPSNSGGGGIAIVGSLSTSVALSFATVTDNEATGTPSLPGGVFVGAAGGGVYGASRGSFTTDDNILAGNAAWNYDAEGTPTPATGPDVSGAVSSLGRNLVGKRDGSSGWVRSDLTGTYAAPLDPVIGPLQDNGGPHVGSTLFYNPYPDPPRAARTHEVLPGSPALQAGNAKRSPATDQRGVARDTARPNIGAYEATVAGFRVEAPEWASAGEPFDVTVTAIDPYGKTVYVYVGTITFGSSDPLGVLPANYTFVAGDNGSHTFAGGVTLFTPGTQTITVWDVANALLDGEDEVEVWSWW
jgi:hypothetical protein